MAQDTSLIILVVGTVSSQYFHLFSVPHLCSNNFYQLKVSHSSYSSKTRSASKFVAYGFLFSLFPVFPLISRAYNIDIVNLKIFLTNLFDTL